MASDTTATTFRASEVAEHRDKKSSWIIIHDQVYDVSKFLDEVRVVVAVRQKRHLWIYDVRSILVERKSYWNRPERMPPKTSKTSAIPLMLGT